MVDQIKVEKLQNEIEHLEEQYERAQLEAMFDRSQTDKIYKQLKKKRRELKRLIGE